MLSTSVLDPLKPREWRLLFPDRPFGAALTGPEVARGIERIDLELLIDPARGEELRSMLAGTTPKSFSRRSPLIDIQSTLFDAAEVPRTVESIVRQLLAATAWTEVRAILGAAGVLDVETASGKRMELLRLFWSELSRAMAEILGPKRTVLLELQEQSARIASDLERRSKREAVFASGVEKYRELFGATPPPHDRSELESLIEDAPMEARIPLIEALHHFPYERFLQAVGGKA